VAAGVPALLDRIVEHLGAWQREDASSVVGPLTR
jgi:hypothetical protein